MDNRVEERIRREMAEQEANGIRRPIDYSIPLEERIEKMRARLREIIAKRAVEDCDPCLIVGQASSLPDGTLEALSKANRT